MELLREIKSMSLSKKISLGVVLFFAFYTFTGFLIAPPIIKWVLTKKLTEQLHREVSIQQIKINPYQLSTNIIGFIINNREDPDKFLSFSELFINLQAASIYKKGLILKEVRLDDPYLNIIRSDDSIYNFSDLLEADRGTEKPTDDSDPFKFSINNIQILNGSGDFLDGPKKTGHKVRDLTISIPMVSNFPYFVETFVQPVFEATINNDPVSLKGMSKPFSDSLETVINLNIDDLDIAHYLSYSPVKLNFDLFSGMISTNNSIAFTQYKDKPSSLTLSGDIVIKNIEIADIESKPLINLPAINISIAPSEISSGKIHLSKVSFQSPEIYIRRDKAGGLNINSLVPPAEPTQSDDQSEESDQAVLVEADEIRIEGGKVVFSDASLEKAVETTLKQIELTGENISTAEESQGTIALSFELNNKGYFSTKGSLGINPLTTNLELDLKDIDIVPLQPYFTDKVKILVTGGKFSTGGNFSLGYAGDEEMNMAYNGKTSLTKFASVDKANANDFLKWKSLYLNGINFKLTPLNVVIDEVALTDFYSRLIINPDGSINVQDIVKAEEGQAEDVPESEGDEAEDLNVEEEVVDSLIKINTVTLQAGTVNFSDRHIKPEYSANLFKIGGRISGLSSTEGTLADVDLKGNLENYAPLEIRGKINPLIKDLYVDLKLDFKDMDLSPLTPYANKYVGYDIQKGKLSLALQYLIANNNIDSKNNIYLDQFTFGEKVDSPDATTLPIKFAVSLLKNSKGEISLDLPVSGNLDDPEFGVGSIVMKMVVNILVKAATSPFALLGALVGDGEELSTVGFDYGSIILNDPEKAKLDKLITALADRPDLSMEIEGFVDIEKDREGLRQFTFNNKVRAQKLKEIVDDGRESVSIDEITIEPEEYEKYLRKAYKEETFPKPRNIIGFAKKLPVPEMEKLILAYIEITDDDLRLLASDRALTVKDYLLKSGQVDQKRIFLTESQSLQPEEKEKLGNSRVDFKLK